MRIILVTYDLKKPGQDYDSLYKILETAEFWWHYLDSTWILATNQTTRDWSNKIVRFLDTNDRLLVVEITNQSRQGWLPRDAWDWITRMEQK